jgi:hypothetical protein
MNYKRFDRHQVFNTVELVRQHSELINDVEAWNIENETNVEDELVHFFNAVENEFVNALYGIWDGYLYTNILTMAMEYPSHIYERVLDTYKLIDEWIEENGAK